MGWGCVLEGGGWGDVNAHGKNVNLGGGEVNAEVLFLGKLNVVQEGKKKVLVLCTRKNLYSV